MIKKKKKNFGKSEKGIPGVTYKSPRVSTRPPSNDDESSNSSESDKPKKSKGEFRKKRSPLGLLAEQLREEILKNGPALDLPPSMKDDEVQVINDAADRLMSKFLGRTFVYETDQVKAGWFTGASKTVHTLTLNNELCDTDALDRGDVRPDCHLGVKMLHKNPLLFKAVWKMETYVNMFGEESVFNTQWYTTLHLNRTKPAPKYMLVSGELLSQILMAAHLDATMSSKNAWLRLKSVAKNIASVNVDRFELTDNIHANTLHVAYFLHMVNVDRDLEYLNLWRHNLTGESLLDADMENYCKIRCPKQNLVPAFGLETIPVNALRKLVKLWPSTLPVVSPIMSVITLINPIVSRVSSVLLSVLLLRYLLSKKNPWMTLRILLMRGWGLT